MLALMLFVLAEWVYVKSHVEEVAPVQSDLLVLPYQLNEVAEV
jgi:hypothetical protein